MDLTRNILNALTNLLRHDLNISLQRGKQRHTNFTLLGKKINKFFKINSQFYDYKVDKYFVVKLAFNYL